MVLGAPPSFPMVLRHWVDERGAGQVAGVELRHRAAGGEHTELDSDLSHIGVICPTEEWTWGGKFETA